MSADTSTLRVLQVASFFAPHVGGTELHVREVARRMPEHDVYCEVLTADASGRLPEREVIDDVTVRRVRGYPPGRDWLFAPSLASAVTHEHWDVIHVQGYHTFVAPLAMRTAVKAHIPWVLTFHGGGHSSALRNAVRSSQLRLLGPLLRKAQALVAIADFEIREYGPIIGVPAGRFVKIPNGADLPPDVAAIPSETPLIVAVGRLERYKGHHRVLAAFPHVLAEIPDARLWIAGAGPEEEALRHQAAALGLTDEVEIGGTERATLAARLKGASAMVLLSDFESHPLSVVEAAFLGVPAVVAANSGMAELADQGLARAVDASAAPDVHAKAIIAAVRGPRPEPRHDIPTWDDCAAQLAALYRRVSNS